MKTIWRYPLTAGVTTTVHKVPKGAKFLAARERDNWLSVWAEIDETAPPSEVEVTVVATGDDHDQYGRYLDTVIIGDDAWHVYVKRADRSDLPEPWCTGPCPRQRSHMMRDCTCGGALREFRHLRDIRNRAGGRNDAA